ncbi:MAG: hypothetical protein ABSA59_08940 [Terriglobia bacterium]|jgi:hypothetical protein
MAAFRLSKWYLDCVTDSGDTSIAYTGAIDWGMVRLHYSSLLESTANGIKVRHSVRERNEPKTKDDSISWRTNALHIDALWQADSVALRETLFRCEDGSVEWHCLMPRARTRFGARFGLGYAENLIMTIPPWQLPIENLRWGRFTSASDWVVWIDWQGEFSRRIVYLNGESAPTLVLEDARIKFVDGALLTMDRSLVIRDGPLGTTTLSAIPGVRRTFPARLLQVHESKWRSRARLELPNGSGVEGWVIHERVRWPK